MESEVDAGLDKIGKIELGEPLTKGWITQNAMWLMHSIEELWIWNWVDHSIGLTIKDLC